MRLKYILTIFSVALILGSCTKDLDLYPKDQISDGSFWRSSRDFEMAVNAFYGALPGHQTADNAAETTFGSGPSSLSNGTYLAPDNSGTWNGTYDAIRAINYVLIKAEEFENKEEIHRWMGEAHFFRAWQYFGLLREFGGVPILTTILDINSEELYAPRNTRDEVSALIISDLQAAIGYLPKQSEMADNEGGRISKGAAQTLLARVALFEGTRAKFHGGSMANERLQIAANAAKSVIDSDEYSLFQDFGTDASYRKLFNEAGENCNEVILSRRYVKDINGTHNHTRWLDQHIYVPTRSLVDSYLCTDGLPIDQSSEFQGYSTMTSEFENRDPRLEQTVRKPGVEYPFFDATTVYVKPPLTGNPVTRTGYAIFKYLGETLDSWEGRAEYDPITFRLGEVLLIYAEAKFELDGSISDSDLDISINKLRSRVGMPALTNAFVTTNGLDMRTEIRRERKVELACEGFRFQDLMRWKTAETEMPKAIRGIKYVGTEYETLYDDLVIGTHINVDADGFIVAEPASARSFDPSKHYLRPLPKQQIQINPNLEQNPGW
ncbi:RagB/SusD family nutrient uptake outer membrane protein [Puteibacter caeruleilacunae]|nr:RagB/SusD family nutrient uptake outer membrane protein [Puteibacter caeruleilacunae]